MQRGTQMNNGSSQATREVTASWTLNDAYYAAFWREFVRHRSRFRRWTVPLGIVLVAGGAAWLGLEPERSQPFAPLVIVFGLVELAWHAWDRARWFEAMKVGAEANGHVSLRFHAGGISHVGPTARGDIDWRAVQGLTRTEGGVFLVLGRGLSIFVPKAALRSAGDLDAIEELHAQVAGPKGEAAAAWGDDARSRR